MAGFSQYHVRLFRDSFETPWGFRLQGGKDLQQPLTIQRVFTGSPAEGELQRGDIILSISERQADTLTHKQAQDLIKFGGGSINLTIQRPPPGRVNIAQPVPKPAVQAPGFRPQKPQPMPHQKAGRIGNLGGHGPDFGADFTRPGPHYGPMSPSRSGTGRNMLSQVQQSFESRGYGGYDPEGVITEPQYTPMKPHSRQFQSLISGDFSTPKYSEPTPVYQQSFTTSVQYRTGPPEPDDDDYEVIPVSERKKAFMGDQPVRKWAPLHITRAPKPAPKPRSPLPPSSGPDFGLHYFAASPSKWGPSRPATAPISPQPTFMSPAVMSQSAYTPASGEIERPQVPAWSGSLRQTGVKQWEEDFSPSTYNPPQALPKPRSVPKKPKQAPVRTAQPFNPAPRTIPIQTQGDEEGPRVVHLQYNSPMGLYSNENVQETLAGQTRAMASQPSGQSKLGGQNPNAPRDWSQSTLYRMIQQEERRSGGGRPPHSSSTTTIETSQQPVHPVSFQPGGGLDFVASDF